LARANKWVRFLEPRRISSRERWGFLARLLDQADRITGFELE
jgi:hypothetical protein